MTNNSIQTNKPIRTKIDKNSLIKTLYLHHIAPICDEDYIMRVLYEKLAKVSKITLIPYICFVDGEIYYEAYVDILEWYETDFAIGFNRLLRSRLEKGYTAYLYHYENMGWPVSDVKKKPRNIISNIVKEYNFEYYEELDRQKKIQDEINKMESKFVNHKLDRTDAEWLTMSYYLTKKCIDNIL